MAEYIEREAAIKHLENHKKVAKERNFILAADEDAIIKFLREKCPVADVVEVRHGEWIKTSYPEVHRCSICNKPSNTSKGLDKYCPNCGAKMDGKGDVITCLNCKHLMFSDYYGECNKQLRIVNPSDTCEYAEPKDGKGEGE